MTKLTRTLEVFGLQPASAERPLTANWKILRALVFVGVGSVVAKLATTIKELAVANWFGRNDSIEAFLLAMVLPVTLTGLVAGSFPPALVPVYMRVRQNQGLEAAQKLLSSVQLVNLVFLAPVLILLGIGAPYYVALLASGFSVAKLSLTCKLLYLLLPTILVTGVIMVWSSVLNAHEKFALPALTPTVTPVICVFALLFSARRWGIFALVAGTVAGPVFEAFLLGRALRTRGMTLMPRWFGMTPELRAVVRQYLPTLAGALVLSLSPIIDQSMAAMLQPGSVAALSYGNKIITGIVALTSLTLNTAVLPYFAHMVAMKDFRACRRTLGIYSRLVLVATIPLSIVLVVLSRPLVRVLFQRGAFTAADTTIVSAVQIGFAFMIPFAAWSTLFVRLLSSLERSDLLAYGALLSATSNVVFNIIFMRKWGVAGIALSTSVVYAVICGFMAFNALKVLRKHDAGNDIS